MNAGPAASQSLGVSCPLNIADGACTRCGRATEPGNVWNICRSCGVVGSRPGAAIVSGPPTENQLPIAICTACRGTLNLVPSHYQIAHTLCPPCQARHAAIVKSNAQVRAVRRANPYPVVMPMPLAKTTTHALALTVAFTYPQCPEPSPPSALPERVSAVADRRVSAGAHHGENVLRVCMRFGCGARLPAGVLGGVCEACARAGFVRPPPAVVQKRVPRRATERPCHRPRESLDDVRALLLREAAQRKATTERKDVEDECEDELVYPDDIPVATQCASISSESKREESKIIEDEDAELNLVYPEDAADAMCVSSSKPQTKVSQPTTLRQLFKDGLQTIPALQDLTALVDRNPPRHCRMPGCNEVLPAQTNMERCVRCRIDDWKRCKSSSMDALDPSRRPSTSSLTTNTSMEKKEVTTMSDVEDESDASPPSSSPRKGSKNGSTEDHGVTAILGWDSDSDLTQLSSDSDTENISDSEPDLKLSWPDGDTTGLRIHIPLLVTQLPPGSLLRKCGNKKCNIALPRDHRWKTCDPCRRAQRMYQRIGFENMRRSTTGIKILKPPDFSCRQWRSLSPEMHETDTTLTPETSRPCSARGCQSRIPLPEVYRWKTCVSCRARARRKEDALLDTQDVSYQPEVVPRFPAYQNRGALLSSFDAQLKGFVEGEIMSFCAKLHDSEDGCQGKDEPWKPENSPIMFIFVGEYSIVTGQRGDSEGNFSHDSDHSISSNDPTDLQTMRQEVSSIVLELEHVLHAKFRAGEAFSIDKGGIIMRFTCSLELIAQLRPLATTVGASSASGSEVNTLPVNKDKDTPSEDTSLTLNPPPNPPGVPLTKTLSGELEAVVVPDESHRWFHGRRMVVRYRMVG